MYQAVRMLVRGDWLSSLLAIVFGIFLPHCALALGKDFVDFVLYICSCIRGQPPNSEDRDSAPQTSLAEGQKDGYGVLAIAFTVCTFSAILSATVVGAILHRDNQRLRMQWTSGAMAPVGATLRWILSRLNRRTPNFPVGTFVANITAVLLDVSIGATLLHSTANKNTALVLSSLITGFAGSLSTVSTWINESASMERCQRYVYLLGTVICAILIGTAVYGPAYWVADANPV